MKKIIFAVLILEIAGIAIAAAKDKGVVAHPVSTRSFTFE